MKRNREYFEQKYAKELKRYRELTSSRELECTESLIDDGMEEASFIGHVIDIDSEKLFKLKELCQIMFDPENQPPQYTIEQAWEEFRKLNE